jgi:hypothetical protein
LTGAVELYHYEESALPGTPQLLDKYLVWTKTADGTAGMPVATK